MAKESKHACKCKKSPECEECPEWIFTFADLVMLMMGFFVIGWTVDFWDTAYVHLLFLMGSGVWMLDVRSKERAALEAQMPRRLHQRTEPRMPPHPNKLET